MSFDADLGPINFVVVAFESAPVPTGGLNQLLDLVDQERILILDVEFIRKADDGSFMTVSASDVGVEAFEGAASHLIDGDDVTQVAEQLKPGGVGVVVVYEDLTLLPTVHAWADEGALVISEGPVALDDLVEAIDASDEEE